MISHFTSVFPATLNLPAVLLSGAESMSLENRVYLVIDDDGHSAVYEIRYDRHCSPFKQALGMGELLAVGSEEYFYLFNRITNKPLLRLKLEGYFSHLYSDDGLFYVADAGGLFCIEKNGTIRWHNNNLAVDGVIIYEFTSNEILGSGEWDPPGGWRNFTLNKKTGTLVS